MRASLPTVSAQVSTDSRWRRGYCDETFQNLTSSLIPPVSSNHTADVSINTYIHSQPYLH